MNKMQLQILGTDGSVLVTVPFDTDHVTYAIRMSGFCGKITETRIAEYIGQLVWQSGNSWDAQKREARASKIARLIAQGTPAASAEQQVDNELLETLSWDALPGYNDDGSRKSMPE